MIKVVTLNLNGIRSASRKGWLDWVVASQPDVLCVQEVKAQLCDLDDSLKRVADMPGHFHCAGRKGYSGVALYSRREPLEVRCGFGNEEFDAEGRYVEADFGALTVISVYVPSGSSSEDRQAAKFRFLDSFAPHLQELRASAREIILCGDINIAHHEIDLKNWRGNRKNSGFLPEERAWLSGVFDDIGWVDVYRRLHPETEGESYTWWSNRGQAWAKNVGWRLDYQIATEGIAAKARKAEIYKDARFSDHAPLTVEYDVSA
ncbi:MAG: exodeoxyribonuclease III [Gammaproteobacteria bacterium]